MAVEAMVVPEAPYLMLGRLTQADPDGPREERLPNLATAPDGGAILAYLDLASPVHLEVRFEQAPSRGQAAESIGRERPPLDRRGGERGHERRGGDDGLVSEDQRRAERLAAHLDPAQFQEDEPARDALQ